MHAVAICQMYLYTLIVKINMLCQKVQNLIIAYMLWKAVWYT